MRQRRAALMLDRRFQRRVVKVPVLALWPAEDNEANDLPVKQRLPDAETRTAIIVRSDVLGPKWVGGIGVENDGYVHTVP